MTSLDNNIQLIALINIQSDHVNIMTIERYKMSNKLKIANDIIGTLVEIKEPYQNQSVTSLAKKLVPLIEDTAYDGIYEMDSLNIDTNLPKEFEWIGYDSEIIYLWFDDEKYDNFLIENIADAYSDIGMSIDLIEDAVKNGYAQFTEKQLYDGLLDAEIDNYQYDHAMAYAHFTDLGVEHDDLESDKEDKETHRDFVEETRDEVLDMYNDLFTYLTDNGINLKNVSPNPKGKTIANYLLSDDEEDRNQGESFIETFADEDMYDLSDPDECRKYFALVETTLEELEDQFQNAIQEYNIADQAYDDFENEVDERIAELVTQYYDQLISDYGGSVVAYEHYSTAMSEHDLQDWLDIDFKGYAQYSLDNYGTHDNMEYAFRNYEEHSTDGDTSLLYVYG